MKLVPNFPMGLAILPLIKYGDRITYRFTDAGEEKLFGTSKTIATFYKIEPCVEKQCTEYPVCSRRRARVRVHSDEAVWCVESRRYRLIRAR